MGKTLGASSLHHSLSNDESRRQISYELHLLDTNSLRIGSYSACVYQASNGGRRDVDDAREALLHTFAISTTNSIVQTEAAYLKLCMNLSETCSVLDLVVFMLLLLSHTSSH